MKIFNPQWNRDMDVSDQLATYMEKNGYEPWHTGGGCMAWRKDEDKKGDAYTMITFVDVELGNWKDRDDPQWIVGRYVWTEDDESWVCCDDGLTLARAVEVGGLLPKPDRDEQRIVPEKDLNRRPRMAVAMREARDKRSKR